MGCFENIMMNHNEKKIIGLCRRLNRKCSLTCNTDVTALCELAYRLYVSGDKKNALHVCECTHTGIPKKINYNVWDFILGSGDWKHIFMMKREGKRIKTFASHG